LGRPGEIREPSICLIIHLKPEDPGGFIIPFEHVTHGVKPEEIVDEIPQFIRGDVTAKFSVPINLTSQKVRKPFEDAGILVKLVIQPGLIYDD
jgi:hypothetical protein